jgi:long-chain fatty acid transport protein
MRRTAVQSAVVAGLALALSARIAGAQGFTVYEHESCTMGRAGTGVASPCNSASAIFVNPAGIVNPAGPKWSASLGTTIISPRFTFQSDFSSVSTDAVANNIPVPNAYITRQFGGATPMAVGIGVFAPYGLRSEWPTDFEGRFLAYLSDLRSLYIQPTMAVQLRSWLQLGVGLDWVYSSVDLKQHVDLSSQVLPSASVPAGTTFAAIGVPLGTDFADAEATGTSFSGAFHVGILVKPTRWLSVGARYLTRTVADIEGHATFTQLSTGIVLPAGNPLLVPGGTPLDSVLAPNFKTTLARQHASVDIPLPPQLVVGLAVRPMANLQLLFDIQRTWYSQFRVLTLTFANAGTRTQYEDYRNTTGFRVGAQYEINRISVRGGWLHHGAAAPSQTVTPLLPEAARNEMTAGLGVPIGRRGRLDVAYQHIWQADRRGRTVDVPRGPDSASLNNGLYTATANLYAASLSWGF